MMNEEQNKKEREKEKEKKKKKSSMPFGMSSEANCVTDASERTSIGVFGWKSVLQGVQGAK
jgi:hypothetical protein